METIYIKPEKNNSFKFSSLVSQATRYKLQIRLVHAASCICCFQCCLLSNETI